MREHIAMSLKNYCGLRTHNTLKNKIPTQTRVHNLEVNCAKSCQKVLGGKGVLNCHSLSAPYRREADLGIATPENKPPRFRN